LNQTFLNQIVESANIQQEDQENDNLLKLFVGGLNYLSLQSDIKSYFETFGKVLNCSLLIDKASSKSRGFAFVTIEDNFGEIKEKILTRKHEINGKIVDVKLAVEGKKREEMLDASRKIFVGGLDPTVSNDDLKYFFSKYGDVREAVVLYDNNRGASRCFGFVTFDSKETVDRLVKDNNYLLKGKQIDVKQALPKALQKTQNIISQSGIDVYLNPKQKYQGNMKSEKGNFGQPFHNFSDIYNYGNYGNMFDDYMQTDKDDRAFVDFITNPNLNINDADKKTTFSNDFYNFPGMFPNYDPSAKKEQHYGSFRPFKMEKSGFKPY